MKKRFLAIALPAITATVVLGTGLSMFMFDEANLDIDKGVSNIIPTTIKSSGIKNNEAKISLANNSYSLNYTNDSAQNKTTPILKINLKQDTSNFKGSEFPLGLGVTQSSYLTKNTAQNDSTYIGQLINGADSYWGNHPESFSTNTISKDTSWPIMNKAAKLAGWNLNPDGTTNNQDKNTFPVTALLLQKENTNKQLDLYKAMMVEDSFVTLKYTSPLMQYIDPTFIQDSDSRFLPFKNDAGEYIGNCGPWVSNDGRVVQNSGDVGPSSAHRAFYKHNNDLFVTTGIGHGVKAAVDSDSSLQQYFSGDSSNPSLTDYTVLDSDHLPHTSSYVLNSSNFLTYANQLAASSVTGVGGMTGMFNGSKFNGNGGTIKYYQLVPDTLSFYEKNPKISYTKWVQDDTTKLETTFTTATETIGAGVAVHSPYIKGSAGNWHLYGNFGRWELFADSGNTDYCHPLSMCPWCTGGLKGTRYAQQNDGSYATGNTKNGVTAGAGVDWSGSDHQGLNSYAHSNDGFKHLEPGFMNVGPTNVIATNSYGINVHSDGTNGDGTIQSHIVGQHFKTINQSNCGNVLVELGENNNGTLHGYLTFDIPINTTAEPLISFSKATPVYSFSCPLCNKNFQTCTTQAERASAMKNHLESHVADTTAAGYPIRNKSTQEPSSSANNPTVTCKYEVKTPLTNVDNFDTLSNYTAASNDTDYYPEGLPSYYKTTKTSTTNLDSDIEYGNEDPNDLIGQYTSLFNTYTDYQDCFDHRDSVLKIDEYSEPVLTYRYKLIDFGSSDNTIFSAKDTELRNRGEGGPNEERIKWSDGTTTYDQPLIKYHPDDNDGTEIVGGRTKSYEYGLSYDNRGTDLKITTDGSADDNNTYGGVTQTSLDNVTKARLLGYEKASAQTVVPSTSAYPNEHLKMKATPKSTSEVDSFLSPVSLPLKSDLTPAQLNRVQEIADKYQSNLMNVELEAIDVAYGIHDNFHADATQIIEEYDGTTRTEAQAKAEAERLLDPSKTGSVLAPDTQGKTAEELSLQSMPYTASFWQEYSNWRQRLSTGAETLPTFRVYPFTGTVKNPYNYSN